MTRTEQEFLAVGHIILGEFELEGEKFVFYKQNQYDPMVFITGDKYDWEFGLQYIGVLQHVAQVYYITDELRREIERNKPRT